jgi:predicted metal-dependent HD superfamily phosphohydrolase
LTEDAIPPAVEGSFLDDAMRERLALLYRAQGRHYHGLPHVAALLDLAAGHADLVADRPAVEAAIWFHDAILDTRRGDNEARSADLAREWLVGRAPQGEIDAVAAMIEATAAHAVPAAAPIPLARDTALFLDLDLSILGSSPERFDAYEAAVRREYDWVGEEDWKKGRSEVLRRFLGRSAIYATDRFRSMLEASARSNIARSLTKLAGGAQKL